MGIRHVGEETAIRLAEHFGTIKKIQAAAFEELQSVADIGPRVAESIAEWFADKSNINLIDELLDSGVKIESPKPKATNLPLAGKTFVITGGLETMTRDEAKAKIRSLGGTISESVSKKTDHVIVGSDPGSKADKAEKLGVSILNEEKFLNLRA